MRKTVEIDPIITALQDSILGTPEDRREYRLGLCRSIELLLTSAGRYGGYTDKGAPGDFRRIYHTRKKLK